MTHSNGNYQETGSMSWLSAIVVTKAQTSARGAAYRCSEWSALPLRSYPVALNNIGHFLQ